MSLPPRDDIEALDSLHRYFRESVSVAAITEPLVSFDAERDAVEVRGYLVARDFDAVGIRVGGLVAGWALQEDLRQGTCAEHTRLFDPGDIIDAPDSLTDLLPRLGRSCQLFVRSLGVVGGIVTRADLQKAPVRMWLFGLLTVLEDTFLRLLRRRFPEERWRSVLSNRRLRYAERLQFERKRRNESLDLTACLHFSDKAEILIRDPEIRERLGFSSLERAREVLREVDSLRTQLAHAHDIVSSSLPVILHLAKSLDHILALARS